MGFRIEGYHRARDARAATLADMVLGGDASSRLFRSVREKHSLAYAIGSSFDPRTGTLYVTAGLDSAVIDRVVRLVRRAVSSIADGSIDHGERDVALRAVSKSIASAHDSPNGLVSFYLGRHLEGKPEIDRERLLARYHRVTAGRMADVFGRLRLDTVFRLEQETTGS